MRKISMSDVTVVVLTKNEEKNIKNVKSKESKELIKEQAKIEIVGKELRDKSKISKEQ